MLVKRKFVKQYIIYLFRCITCIFIDNKTIVVKTKTVEQLSGGSHSGLQQTPQYIAASSYRCHVEKIPKFIHCETQQYVNSINNSIKIIYTLYCKIVIQRQMLYFTCELYNSFHVFILSGFQAFTINIYIFKDHVFDILYLVAQIIIHGTHINSS